MNIRRPNGISAIDLAAGAARESTEEAPLLDSENPAMIALLETVQRAATADTTILLNGESGTGKDVLARQIHRWSPRRGGPFVVINCTTLAEHLLENELFGHVRGAFTGAAYDKPGRFEAGHGGTVLFDEIAELPTSPQTKFLRFIQEHSFERIGGSDTIRLDVRLIAASNRNLETEVAAGRFREDLYYRLNVITFTLPPLRERTRDILPFAEWMLKRMSSAAGHRELGRLTPTQKAVGSAGQLIDGQRECPRALTMLRSMLRRFLARSHTITFDDLPDSVRHSASGMFVRRTRGTRLKDFERELLSCACWQKAQLLSRRRRHSVSM